MARRRGAVDMALGETGLRVADDFVTMGRQLLARNVRSIGADSDSDTAERAACSDNVAMVVNTAEEVIDGRSRRCMYCQADAINVTRE